LRFPCNRVAISLQCHCSAVAPAWYVLSSGVPFDMAMHASRDAMDSGIDPTVRMLGSGMGSLWDDERDALLARSMAARP